MTTSEAHAGGRPGRLGGPPGRVSAVVGLVGGDHTRIPPSHRDLVECPPVASLTTLMPDGSPQTSVVWCDFDGTHVRVNTMRGFQKERNMRRDPRVALLCYDPGHPHRYLEVQGIVESMREDGALEHLDALASKYAGHLVRYFGDCIPARFSTTEVPVLCRIRPLRVTAMAAGDRVEDP
jgi:PPOX class probable F420-dependent enzyme